MRRLKILIPILIVAPVLAAVLVSSVPGSKSSSGAPESRVCLPCKMEVNPGWRISSVHDGKTYVFCTELCKRRFDAAPRDFLASRCLVCEKVIDGAGFTATYLGKPYALCSEAHRSAFKAEPATFFMHSMWGIPTWLYYSSIAFVLVLSFGLFDWLGRRSHGRSSPADSRLDLLRVGWIRRALRSRVFRFSMQATVTALFALIVAAGLFGNQNPALNIAPLLTWTIWWGLLPIWIIFAGKIWCYVCPWDAVAGWTEKLALWKKRLDGLSLGMRWPRIIRNISIATILFVGLTWVELGFGVTMRPAVTAYLAAGMLLLAIVSALLFDRKSFCRYGCLVGRVSGLYAMFGGVEVRSRDAGTCSACASKECVTGSAEAYGCPTYLYPGKLQVNTYCIQCMECVQACPHDNIAFNARPLGSDLASEGKPRADEAYLALLMLSITGFHGLTMTPVWRDFVDFLRGDSVAGPGSASSTVVSFSAGMALIMLAPVVVYAGLVGLSKRLGERHAPRPLGFRDYFVRYAYALLPIALFYHIAHNLEHLLMEGPKVVALASDPFGWNWNLFGTASWSMPPLISLDKLWLVQVFLVLVGHVYSLWVAQRTSLRLFGSPRAAFRSQLPMLLGMVLFSVFSLWLLKQPMEMRTSAM